MSDSTFSISDAKRRYWIGAFVIALFLGVMSFGIGSASKMLSAPPEAFPIGEDVTIEEGSKVADIVQNLEDKRLV
jgi:cell division protein YceG involved in septum cleavage